jgi:DNA-binding transcriptional ArsR family regulator
VRDRSQESSRISPRNVLLHIDKSGRWLIRLVLACSLPCHRLRILGMLRGGGLCVCQITAVLDLAASTVSAHLADLRRAGLVFELVRSLSGDDPRIEADARLVRGLRRVPVEELCRVDLDVTRLGLTRAVG